MADEYAHTPYSTALAAVIRTRLLTSPNENPCPDENCLIISCNMQYIVKNGMILNTLDSTESVQAAVSPAFFVPASSIRRAMPSFFFGSLLIFILLEYTAKQQTEQLFLCIMITALMKHLFAFRSHSDYLQKI